MEYRVIEYFTDLQDNNHAYHVGDIFPRDGVEVTPSRIAELSGSKNRRKMPLIEGVADKQADKADAVADETPNAEPKKRKPRKNGKSTN